MSIIVVLMDFTENVKMYREVSLHAVLSAQFTSLTLLHNCCISPFLSNFYPSFLKDTWKLLIL